MKWNVRLTNAARNQLLSIKDSRIRAQILKRIDALENDPEKQGKALDEDLFGYRSIRTVKERYRILFRIEAKEVIVLVVMLGIRKEGDKKDVYALAKKLARLGLLDLVTPLLALQSSETDKQPGSSENE